jgi:hypothetical protein
MEMEMAKSKKTQRIIGKVPNFFITGSFLMTLVIGLLVGYNQLQQKYQEEKWIAAEKQDIRIEQKIDNLSVVINEKMEADYKKIEDNSKKIAVLWQELKNRTKTWVRSTSAE